MFSSVHPITCFVPVFPCPCTPVPCAAQVRTTLAGFGELRECREAPHWAGSGATAAVQYADARRTEAAAAALTAVRVQVGPCLLINYSV